MYSRKPVPHLLCILLLVALGIGAAAPSSLRLEAPTTVPGGDTIYVVAEMNEMAPKGGTVVTLTSSNPAVTVPASVTIPAGRNYIEFQTATRAVATDTSVTITATDGSLTATASVDIKVQSLHLEIPPNIPGGVKAAGIASLEAPAPAGGATITLASSNPAVTVPASVTIPAGRNYIEFQIVTTAVASNTNVTVTANDGSLTTTTGVVVLAPAVAGVEVNYERGNGNSAATGIVGLTSLAGTGGFTVQLSSNNAAVSIPATVRVPAGQWVVTFPVTITATPQPVIVTISATANGVTKTFQLQVR